MNRMFLLLFKTLHLVFICGCIMSIKLIANSDDFNQPLHGKTYLAPRSQSVNAARELVAWTRYINQSCKDDWYGAVAIVPEVNGSFRPERIAQYYWANDELVITGSQVAGRDNQTQILADYFGLPTTFQSRVGMKPTIIGGLIDIQVYLGYQDFYVRMHLPYAWTRWNFQLFEEVVPESVPGPPYPALYMDGPAVPAPAVSFTQAIAGELKWGQVTQPLANGLINGPHHAASLAEAQIAVGYNFYNDAFGHAGLNIRGSIPAGTRSDGILLFQPIIGNGHHYELGFGFTGHALLWEQDGEQTICIYSDINITHLFASRQRRSFDLIDPAFPENNLYQGFGTRYILAKIFNPAGDYTGVSTPVINITTLDCDVSVAIQIDAVIMASYADPDYTFDLGYNVWFRSREMISNRQPIAHNTYALKGIQNTNLTLITLSNATQSTATIYGDLLINQAADEDLNSPVFFNDNLIDDSSAEATRGFTHKVFGNFSYNWIGCSTWASPFLGIGGQIEFEGLNPRHQIKANKNSISQWAFWIKGGFGF